MENAYWIVSFTFLTLSALWLCRRQLLKLNDNSWFIGYQNVLRLYLQLLNFQYMLKTKDQQPEEQLVMTLLETLESAAGDLPKETGLALRRLLSDYDDGLIIDDLKRNIKHIGGLAIDGREFRDDAGVDYVRKIANILPALETRLMLDREKIEQNHHEFSRFKNVRLLIPNSRAIASGTRNTSGEVVSKSA